MQDIRQTIVTRFWERLAKKDWEGLLGMFSKDAVINWPNTNETFMPSRYVEVNKNYPGAWDLDLELVETTEKHLISVTRIRSKTEPISLRDIAFYQISDGLIVSLTEYFADDQEAPGWRR